MKHDALKTEDRTTILAHPDALYLHPSNPRQDAPEADIAALADSIAACGLLQNLCGVMDEDGTRIGVVAGGRRMRAVARLAKEGRGDGPYPVLIAPDAETALRWAQVENAARAALHPADEIGSYAKMAEQGASLTDIAIAFAVPEAQVRQRLALASLPAEAIDALRAGKLSLDGAKAMTICDDAARVREALEAIFAERIATTRDLKAFLKPQAVRETDRRAVFVGRAAYEAKGGTVTSDLFSEDVFYDDEAILDEVFAERLAEIAETVAAEGWKWVETTDARYLGYYDIEQARYARVYAEEGELSEAEAEEYDELADLANAEALDEEGETRLAVLQAISDGAYSPKQKAVAGAILYVDTQGALRRAEGLIRHEDKAEAREAGVLAKPEATGGGAKEKPLYSAKLAEDLEAIRLGALQEALLAKPELVLDVLGFALSGEAGYFQRVLDMRLDGQRNVPGVAEGFGIDERLTTTRPDPWSAEGRLHDVEDIAAAFAAFREKGKKHRNGAITRAIARVVNGGGERGALAAPLTEETGAKMRDVWTPTAENFFKRVSGPYLEEVYRDVFAVKASDEGFKRFAKLKKGDKAAWLEKLFAADAEHAALNGVTPETAARVADWTPKAA